jgi:hypothetical protein
MFSNRSSNVTRGFRDGRGALRSLSLRVRRRVLNPLVLFLPLLSLRRYLVVKIGSLVDLRDGSYVSFGGTNSTVFVRGPMAGH